ncbi:MAG: cysteine rich repeat-containing protein [Bdellovibrionota bacterium]
MKSIRVILALACIGLFTTSVVSEDAFARREGGGKGRKGMKKGGGKRAARKQACKADIASLCAGVVKGGGRLMCCLKQNEASQSAECSAGLTKAKKYAALDAATCTTTGTNAGWPSTDETAVDPALAGAPADDQQ